MSANPWDKFFWNDWSGDEGLKLCSLAAQGLWMRMLCICAKADPKGYLLVAGQPVTPTDLALLVGKPSDEVELLLNELSSRAVFSRDRIGRIYSRKMLRDAKKARTAKQNGKLGGNPSLGNNKEIPASDNPQDKGGDKPHKPEAISQGLGSNEPKQENMFDAEFPPWYETYPRKVGRGQALKAYRAARKKASAQDLLAGAQRARREFANTDQQFIPHPSTWLNGERWLDQSRAHGRSPPDDTFGGVPIETVEFTR